MPDVVMELGTTMDLFPSFCRLAGIDPPDDRVYDGHDISPVILGTGSSPVETIYYYRGTEVFAIRHGSYKAHFKTRQEYGDPAITVHEPPLLYNLDIDPSERFDIADKNPGIIAGIREILEKHLATVIPVENQLEK